MSDRELPLASIVIPSYQRGDLLRLAVDSCARQDYPADRYEVIVVDSSPTPSNVELVEELAHTARCDIHVLRKKPEGPGPSRTLGAERSRGEFIAFMDSDCIASEHWLRSLVCSFETGVGLVQGITLPVPEQPYHVLNRSHSITEESFIYHATNIAYRREPFFACDGFRGDEQPESMVVIGGEDTELAWKVKRRGWESRFAHDGLVYHAVERVSPIGWLFDKRMVVVPRIPRDFPETRRFFFLRFFFDRVQAYFTLLLAGLGASVLSPWFLLLALPYVLLRASEHTVALRGPLRVLRALIYFPRDLCTFIQLLRGSIRYRSLLL